MEQDQNTNDQIIEQTTPETEETPIESPKGILYETSLKQAEKNAKKEKRKGVINSSNTLFVRQAQALFKLLSLQYCKQQSPRAVKR